MEMLSLDHGPPSHYQFAYTGDHLKHPNINPLRYSFNEVGSQALGRLPKLPKLSSISSSEFPALDLYSVLENNHADDSKLAELRDKLNSVSNWVD